ncbi:MAG: hypothetical protein K6F50_10580 [Kiritimatiellae bacterium]|nr:hypothetical protein [Kiritimatiellia bacterium]
MFARKSGMVCLALTAFAAQAAVSTWKLPDGGFDDSSLIHPCAPAGGPDIPYKILDLRIPDGYAFSGAEVVTSAYETVSAGKRPNPIAEPHVAGAEPFQTVADDSLYVDHTAVYEVMEEKIASGVRFLPVKVFPYRYTREGDVIERATALSLRFNWRAAMSTMSTSSTSAKNIAPSLKALALSGENVVETDEPVGMQVSTMSTTQSTKVADVIIISPPAFTNVWEQYKAYRESTTDYSFAIKNTDEIYAEYADALAKTTVLPGGSWVPDHALAIHKYIESVYSTGTSHIILGASCPIMNAELNTTNQIPIRYVRNTNNTATDNCPVAPSDMYFACMDKLDGAEVWDYQGDGVYCGTGSEGSTAWNTALNTTGMDWAADLVVMRIPFAESLKCITDPAKGTQTSYTAEQLMAGLIDKLRRTEGQGENFDGRGKNMIVGGMGVVLYTYNHGSTEDKIISEREFFDEQYNMFDREHPDETLDVESDPRLVAYNIFYRYRAPKESYVIAGDMKNDESVHKAWEKYPGYPQEILNKLGTLKYNDKFLKYSDAIANNGDVYYVDAHGIPGGVDDVSYYTENLWKQTSVHKLCFASNPCLTGRLDCDTKSGEAYVRCAAQAGVMAPLGGCVASFNNTRMGLTGGSVNWFSPRVDYQICRYAYGVVDGVEYPAGTALLKARQSCSDMNDGSSASICLTEVLGCGDPFIKLTPQRDRFWTGAAGDGKWSAASTNWTSCISSPIISKNSTEFSDAGFDISRRVYAKSDTAIAQYTVDGNFAATELRLEAPMGVAISGGRFRSTVLTSITNATYLSWSSEGGAGRDGIEFVGSNKGIIMLPGNEKRYFGTKFSNVGEIQSTGGNTTLDFSYHAVTPAKLSFCGDDATKRNVYTNTVRTKLDNSTMRLASDATVALENSTLNIENSGFLRGQAGAANAISAKNANIVVRNGPRWDTAIVSRGLELNDSSLVLDYANVQLGDSGFTWPISATGGSSTIESTSSSYAYSGDVSFDVASGASLDVTAEIASSGKTLTKTGEGTLTIASETALSNAVVSVKGGTMVIPASTNITVSLDSGANLKLVTTQAAISGASSTPVALCAFTPGSAGAGAFTNRVTLVDSAGTAISVSGLVTTPSSDGLVYLSKAGEVEYATLSSRHANVLGNATWPTDSNLEADVDWVDNILSTIELTNTTGAATVTFNSVTAKSLAAFGDKPLTVHATDASSASISEMDFSAISATGTISGFSVPTLVAGADTVLSNGANVTGTAVIPADSTLTLQDIDSISAAISPQASSSILRYAGSTAMASFPYMTTATPCTVAVARPYSGTDLSIGGGSDSPEQNFIIQDGFTASVSTFRPGNGKGDCNITQTGGTVTVTGTSNVTGSSGNNCSCLFAHWPGKLSYAMTGGSILAEGAWIRLSWDGASNVSVGGGEGEAKIKTLGLYNGAERSTTANLSILPKGIVEVGADGIDFSSSGSKLTLAGGTLAFNATARAKAVNGISVTADSVIDVAEGAVATIESSVSCSDRILKKTGAGKLILNQPDTISDSVDVYGGALHVESATTAYLHAYESGKIEVHNVDAGTYPIQLFRTIQSASDLEGHVEVYDAVGNLVSGTLSVEANFVYLNEPPEEDPVVVHDKPLADAYGMAFGYFFNGGTDGKWETLSNWSRNGVYTNLTDLVLTGGNIPQTSNSEVWDPLMFDGNLMMNLDAAEDGMKHVTSPDSAASNERVEGWEMQMVLTNSVCVEIGRLRKMQASANNTRIVVDRSSRLVIKGYESDGHNNGTHDFLVSSPSGVLFTAAFTPNQTGSLNYRLGEKGSVQYAALAGNGGTHVVKSVTLDLGDSSLNGKKLVSRKLIGFTSKGSHSFSSEGVEISASDPAAALASSSEELGSSSAVGAYRFHEESDGYYVDYIAYAQITDELGAVPVHWYTFDDDLSNIGAQSCFEGECAAAVYSNTVENTANGRAMVSKDGSLHPYGTMTGSQAFTVALSLKSVETTNAVLFAIGSVGSKGAALLGCGKDRIRFALHDANSNLQTWDVEVSGAASQYHHYAIKYTGTAYKVYVDGQVGVVAGSANELYFTREQSNRNLQLGGMHGGNGNLATVRVSGVAVDDFRVYAEALDDSKIAQYASYFPPWPEMTALRSGIDYANEETVAVDATTLALLKTATGKSTAEDLNAKSSNGLRTWQNAALGILSDGDSEAEDFALTISLDASGSPVVSTSAGNLTEISIASPEKTVEFGNVKAKATLQQSDTLGASAKWIKASAETSSSARFYRIQVIFE